MSELNFAEIRQKIFEKQFSYLNKEQKEAVSVIEGPLLLLAGAGTGKTTTLISRIFNMIKYGRICQKNESKLLIRDIENINNFLKGLSKEIPENTLSKLGYIPLNPYTILIITFTNKAAKSLKDKLYSLLGETAEKLHVGTFHSEFYMILRKYSKEIGHKSNFSLFSEFEQKQIIREYLKSNNNEKKREDVKEAEAKDDLKTISMAKNTLTIDKIKNSKLYIYYEEQLKHNNAIDVDDILYLTYKLLLNNPEILNEIRRIFQYVMVDEYQDTNMVQFEILKMIAGKNENICVVGDDDQSIYKFRGADVSIILSFKDKFPKCSIIKLEQNYRSTQKILNVANFSISKNISRLDKKLWSEKKHGDDVKILKFSTRIDEASYISKYIRDECLNSRESDNKIKFSDFAILYRKNYQSSVFENSLMQNLIPFEIYGSISFYSRVEIKNILAYLEVVVNPNNDVSLERILNSLKCGIGKITISIIKKISREHKQSMIWVCKNCELFKDELSRALAKISKFSELMENIIKAKEKMDLYKLTKHILSVTNTIEYYEESSSLKEKARVENIKKLLRFVKKEIDNNKNLKISSFLDKVLIIGKSSKNGNTVSLMTCHMAKGLEFPYVFLVGLEDGNFPLLTFNNSRKEITDIEEERRLFYVAITRAKKKLFMSSSVCNYGFIGDKEHESSRFIQELLEYETIGEGLKLTANKEINNSLEFLDFNEEMKVENKTKIEKNIKKEVKNFSKNLNQESLMRLPNISNEHKNNKKIPYEIGDIVFHSTFGNGVVKSILENENAAKVNILFGDVLRTFNSSLLKLTKIS